MREWVRGAYGDVEVADVGSEINVVRRGLWKLIEVALRRQVDAVVAAYRDRPAIWVSRRD